MTIDPTLSLGSLLNAGVLLVGFIIAFVRIGGRIDLLTQRVSAVEEILKNSADITSRVTAIETRQVTHGQLIAGVQEDLRDLKYGRGFITNRSKGGIEGEYP